MQLSGTMTILSFITTARLQLEWVKFPFPALPLVCRAILLQLCFWYGKLYLAFEFNLLLQCYPNRCVSLHLLQLSLPTSTITNSPLLGLTKAFGTIQGDLYQVMEAHRYAIMRMYILT